MNSKFKLVLSLLLIGLPATTFANDTRLSEGNACPVCKDQNRPVIDVEEINAKFEIFTDENNYQWCEEQQRYYVWGKCSGPTLTSGVKTKNATYKHTGQVYNSEFNNLVYEGTCEGAEPPTITGSDACEAKVTKDSDGNITSVQCNLVATPPACANDPLFGSIGSPCTLYSDEVDCNATSEGTYQCKDGKVVCDGKKPTCLIPCDEMAVPAQGVQDRGSSTEIKFKTAKGFESGVQIGYTCVRTGATNSKTEVYEAGMFGWGKNTYRNNYAQMITASITGNKTPKGWYDDRAYFKQNRSAANNAYNNKSACYVCGSIRINGCFAPDTNLTLADGSVKQAKDVITGDVLFNPVTKKGVTVEKVIEGPEAAEMVLIEYAGGSLKVSQEHPVLTKNGLVQAKDLKAGDTVFNGDNKEFEVASVKTLPVEEGQYVINFIVKGDDDIKDYKNRMLLSEGIVTGDLTTQIELKLGK